MAPGVQKVGQGGLTVVAVVLQPQKLHRLGVPDAEQPPGFGIGQKGGVGQQQAGAQQTAGQRRQGGGVAQPPLAVHPVHKQQRQVLPQQLQVAAQILFRLPGAGKEKELPHLPGRTLAAAKGLEQQLPQQRRQGGGEHQRPGVPAFQVPAQRLQHPTPLQGAVGQKGRGLPLQGGQRRIPQGVGVGQRPAAPGTARSPAPKPPGAAPGPPGSPGCCAADPSGRQTAAPAAAAPSSRLCSWAGVGWRWPLKILYRVERSIPHRRASSAVEPG